MLYTVLSCSWDKDKPSSIDGNINQLYFANVDLVNDFMMWLDERSPLSPVTEVAPMVAYTVPTSDGGNFVVSISPISCEGYDNHKEIYILEYYRVDTKANITAQIFVNIEEPLNLANKLNALTRCPVKAKLYRHMVISSEEDLTTLKKYLTSCDDMLKQIHTFHSMEEVV